MEAGSSECVPVFFKACSAKHGQKEGQTCLFAQQLLANDVLGQGLGHVFARYSSRLSSWTGLGIACARRLARRRRPGQTQDQ